MGHIDLITSLPTRLSCNVLLDWIDLSSVRSLDCAYCSHSLRREYLDVMANETINTNQLVRLNTNSLHWLVKRQLVPSNLYVCGSVDLVVARIFFSSFGQRVRKLMIARALDSELLELITNHLHCLISVRYNMWDSGCVELMKVNPGLEVFSSEFLKELSVTHSREAILNVSLPKLHTLQMHNSLLNLETSNGGVLAFATMWKFVVKLDLYYSLVSDEALLQIAQHCPHIRSLGLAKVDVGDKSFDAITRANPDILHLDLRWNRRVTDVGIRSIATNLKGLRSLHIQNIDYLTSQTLTVLHMHCAASLHTLYVENTTKKSRFDRADLNMLLDKCSHLRTLGLSDINTDQLTSNIANLTTIVLEWSAISDSNLIVIGTYCKQLRVLSIVPDWDDWFGVLRPLKYTSTGLEAVAFGCPLLEDVYLDSQVPDKRYISLNSFVKVALTFWRKLRPKLNIIELTSADIPAFDILSLPV